MSPPSEGVLDVRMAEIALFVGGAIVTVMVLALGVWLFVRASREEREQVKREEKERAGPGSAAGSGDAP